MRSLYIFTINIFSDIFDLFFIECKNMESADAQSQLQIAYEFWPKRFSLLAWCCVFQKLWPEASGCEFTALLISK